MPAEWFVYLAVRKSCATARPVGELVEFMRTWHGSKGAVSARRVHDLQVHDGPDSADRIWCGDLSPAAQLTELAAAKDRGHGAV